MTDAPRTVAVLGLDEHNQEVLHTLSDADRYRFVPVLGIEELQYAEEIPVLDLLEKAKKQLDELDPPAQAVIGFWDFPVSTMVPLLCEHTGTPGPSLDAVLRCEHKYWSRLEQQAVIDEYPAFGLVDPDQDTELPPSVRFPVWVKPVKSFSSDLAFRADDEAGYREALRTISEGIGRVGEPFAELMAKVDAPDEIAAAGGRACVVEEAVGGRQITLEGWVGDGDVHVVGAVDTVNRDDVPSQDRFVYPSSAPEELTARMAEVARRFIERVGLAHTTFNIEFFWDPDSDRLTVLEVNPRHSQSHAELFADVDGAPNHLAMVQLALGEEPRLPHRQGRYAVAAKCFFRWTDDGVVRRVPTAEDVARVEREVPGTTVDVIVHEGERLSRLPDQDSYSYKVANVYVGAQDREQLAERFRRCTEMLPFDFDPADPDDPADPES